MELNCCDVLNSYVLNMFCWTRGHFYKSNYTNKFVQSTANVLWQCNSALEPDKIQNHQYFGKAQNGTKKEIKDAYPFMSKYSYANSHASIENQYPQNGISIPCRI